MREGSCGRVYKGVKVLKFVEKNFRIVENCHSAPTSTPTHKHILASDVLSKRHKHTSSTI